MKLSLEWDPGTIDTFSLAVGEKLVASIRDIRRLGLKPSLVLSHSEFTMLLDYWPQFYLTGPVITTHIEDNPCSRLRRLFGRLFTRKKRISPTLSIQFSNGALNGVREQMLKRQAIPVDSTWVPVNILENETAKEILYEPVEMSQQDLTKQ